MGGPTGSIGPGGGSGSGGGGGGGGRRGCPNGGSGTDG